MSAPLMRIRHRGARGPNCVVLPRLQWTLGRSPRNVLASPSRVGGRLVVRRAPGASSDHRHRPQAGRGAGSAPTSCQLGRFDYVGQVLGRLDIGSAVGVCELREHVLPVRWGLRRRMALGFRRRARTPATGSQHGSDEKQRQKGPALVSHAADRTWGTPDGCQDLVGSDAHVWLTLIGPRCAYRRLQPARVSSASRAAANLLLRLGWCGRCRRRRGSGRRRGLSGAGAGGAGGAGADSVFSGSAASSRLPKNSSRFGTATA